MPFGYKFVKTDEYNQIIKQNNGMIDRTNELDKRILDLEAKEGARVVEANAELALARDKIKYFEIEYGAVCANYNNLYEVHQDTLKQHSADIEAVTARAQDQIDKIQQASVTERNRLQSELENAIGLAGAAESALHKDIADLNEKLAERDAELQRSVQQATDLGYDNEQLRKTIEDQAMEIEALKRSENEKWETAMAAQAEVVLLKAEVEKLTPKPRTPRKRGGK